MLEDADRWIFYKHGPDKAIVNTPISADVINNKPPPHVAHLLL